MAPRLRPYQSWPPVGLALKPLLASGSGTEPSAVWPNQILFIACACTGVTQAAVALVPTTPPVPTVPVHSAAASRAGS